MLPSFLYPTLWAGLRGLSPGLGWRSGAPPGTESKQLPARRSTEGASSRLWPWADRWSGRGGRRPREDHVRREEHSGGTSRRYV